ncbi:MAG TPA: hypothetical protein VLG40_00250, partial [Candidatus Saccharimonas sp.]|nr:hypothetical protein [Candidatus Saccharimonas sp.]
RRQAFDLVRIYWRGLTPQTAYTVEQFCRQQLAALGEQDFYLSEWWLVLLSRALLVQGGDTKRREAKVHIDEALKYVDTYGTPALKIQLLCDQLYCVLYFRTKDLAYNEFGQICAFYLTEVQQGRIVGESQEIAQMALKSLATQIPNPQQVVISLAASFPNTPALMTLMSLFSQL